MIPYIGDISEADAEVLAELAVDSMSALEFGCGASTQVIAMYSEGEFTSIDTSEEWITRTQNNLDLLEIGNKTRFFSYNHFMGAVLRGNSTYDFIFVDGVDELRREFATRIWPYIQVDGTMAFHDTRRAHDFMNVLEVLATFQNEIGLVSFNHDGSNITLIQKKEPEPYDNWQITENKQPWQLGYGDIPAEELARIKEQVSKQ